MRTVMLRIANYFQWMQMLRNWPKWERSPKMVERVHKGIPAGVRGQARALGVLYH